MKSSVITVSQLNYYIKSLVDGDAALNSVFVIGEISNFTSHYKSGHFYFSLKDEKSIVKCVMFKTYAARVKFRPVDGMRIVVRGKVSVYEAGGQYQMYVEDMQPDGIGALNLAFEQLKDKLAKEGLFDAAKKRLLPPFPMRIGVITSPTGAAIRDIENILARRFPIAQVIVCPVLVQGEEAPVQIIDAIERFNRVRAADVLIVGRGGGSIEDLWAFNDEGVARAVAASVIPVISAVGHETDFTICDFVADLRAPTPSAAAELAVPDKTELLNHTHACFLHMRQAMVSRISHNKMQLGTLLKSHSLKSPLDIIEQRRLYVDTLCAQINSVFSKQVAEQQSRFAALSGKLHMLSPLQVLSRGYLIALANGDKPLKSIQEVSVGQSVQLRLSDGTLGCTITSKEEGTVIEK